MKTLLSALCALLFYSANSQVSGKVTLQGATDHSNVKIRFIAKSGTAVTDSVLTDASGNFSRIISGGVYYVIYSRAGYQSHYFDGGSPVVLSNATVLSPVTMAPGHLIAVSGSVSGQWDKSSTYLVTGNLTVLPGQTLTIKAGTVVKFGGSFSLTAQGVLHVLGSNAEPVHFTSYKSSPFPADWMGLLLKSTSRIENSKFEYCTTCISVENNNSVISGNEISDFESAAISMSNSYGTCSNNTIQRFRNYQYSFGIVLYQGAPIVECNSIFNGNGRGITVQSGGIVRNNFIHNIDYFERGYGIECRAFATASISNNVIYGCVDGIYVGENVTPAPSPTIANNTIYRNGNGINIAGFYGTPAIIGNNITMNSRYGVSQYTCSFCNTQPSVLSYNNVWANNLGEYYNVTITGVGQAVNTNANGHPIDSYFNMSMDPEFIENGPALKSTSPLVGSGSPAHSSNIGVNVNAFCAGMATGINDQETHYAELQVRPNPFTNAFHIEGIGANITNVTLFDIEGRSFSCDYDQIGDRLMCNTGQLPAGIYFCRIDAKYQPPRYCRLVKN